MPYEPSPWLVALVTERLRMGVDPDPRFPGDEPAEWAESEFGRECRILRDKLAVLDDDEIAERSQSLVDDAKKLLGMS
jgi:hypothetical protein